MSSRPATKEGQAAPRRRLPREARYRQLMEVAWGLVGQEGTEALTLGRLAEQAGVAKPVVYSHFPTRAALLAALYRAFDARQHALMDAALAEAEASLAGRAEVIASTYVGCVLAQGSEIPGVSAALASSPELEEVKRECEAVFLERCRAILSPFGKPSTAALRGMLGAAEALSAAAAAGEVTAEEARQELFETIVALVTRAGGGEAAGA